MQDWTCLITRVSAGSSVDCALVMPAAVVGQTEGSVVAAVDAGNVLRSYSAVQGSTRTRCYSPVVPLEHS